MKRMKQSRSLGGADFQVCRVVGFQTRRLHDTARPADWEIGDTAGFPTFIFPTGLA